MTRQESVRRGVAVTTGLAVVGRGVGVLAGLLMLRVLTASELGVFMGVQAIAMAGCGLCDLGLSFGFRQQVSRQPELRSSLFVPVALTQASLLFLYLISISIYMAYKDLGGLIPLLIAANALVLQWARIFVIDLQIRKQFSRAGLLNLVPILGLSLGLLISLPFSHALPPLVIVQTFSVVVVLLFGLRGSWSSALQVRPGAELAKLRKISFPFFVSIVISRLGEYFGLSWVMGMLGSVSVGMLGVPTKIYQTALFFNANATGVTIPHFHSLAHAGDTKRLGKDFGRLLMLMCFLGGSVAGIFYFASEPLVLLVAGSQYTESIVLMPLFGFAVFAKMLAVPAGNLLESRNRQWLRVVGQAVSTAIIVVGTILLLPNHGIWVVALVRLLADFWLLLWNWSCNLPGMLREMPNGKALLALCWFLLSLVLARWLPVVPLLQAAAFTVAFLGGMLGFRLIRIGDLKGAIRQ